MNTPRNILIIALLYTSFMIWQIWQTETSLNFTDKISQKIDLNRNRQQFIEQNKRCKIIRVETDVLLLYINTNGGNIEQAYLLTYADKLGSNNPVHLLKTSKNFIYQAESGLIFENGLNNHHHSINHAHPIYKTSFNNYILHKNEDELHVPLTYIDNNNLLIYTKTFIFKRGDFFINVIYNINNTYKTPIELKLFGQLKQSINLPKIDSKKNINNFDLHTYRGAAYSTNENKYQKYSFKDIKKKRLYLSTKDGWIAMLQKYFVTAWIPLTRGNNTIYTNYLNNDKVIIGFESSSIIIPPGKQDDLKAILWIGPKIQDKMETVVPYLNLVVDYGWLWFISQPLFKLLKFIHSYVNNWGFSIIIITFIVRCIMYPLTKVQYTSMAKIRMLQPKLIAMRERLGEDKKRQSQEMMDLYKTEKVNPLGGCLPLIIQMPIFLALYYMLSGSIELRHAPFALWIDDLSSQDPYYILPVILGITMFCIQKMTPYATTSDPMQTKIMNFVPVLFTIFFLWFPSGLVLYYAVSNLVSIVQQKIIYRSLEKKGLHSNSRDKKTK